MKSFEEWLKNRIEFSMWTITISIGVLILYEVANKFFLKSKR